MSGWSVKGIIFTAFIVNVHGYAYSTIKRATDRFKAYQKEIVRDDMSIPS